MGEKSAAEMYQEIIDDDLKMAVSGLSGALLDGEIKIVREAQFRQANANSLLLSGTPLDRNEWMNTHFSSASQ